MIPNTWRTGTQGDYSDHAVHRAMTCFSSASSVLGCMTLSTNLHEYLLPFSFPTRERKKRERERERESAHSLCEVLSLCKLLCVCIIIFRQDSRQLTLCTLTFVIIKMVFYICDTPTHLAKMPPQWSTCRLPTVPHAVLALFLVIIIALQGRSGT